jgi:hypothetical protein
MTHTGEGMGVSATNEHISVLEMGFLRIASGKIAEMWGLLDTMGLMQQIGAMPSSDQPTSAQGFSRDSDTLLRGALVSRYPATHQGCHPYQGFIARALTVN